MRYIPSDWFDHGTVFSFGAEKENRIERLFAHSFWGPQPDTKVCITGGQRIIIDNCQPYLVVTGHLIHCFITTKTLRGVEEREEEEVVMV